MREIKFKYIIENEDGKIITLIEDIEEIEMGTPLEKSHKIVARCQYTGLKDKNGKDIYEGDIVKKYWQQNNDNGFLSFVVRWEEKTVGFNLTAKGKKHCYEVIDNIHENPELIE